ncbi:MAG: hypothetical protein OES34_06660 [Nitrosopumilus sp.]|nr:hypothetical protein [Nitrosopumilus sp.]
MAGTGVIYRLDNAAENEGTAPEKIEFNDGATPDATGNTLETLFHQKRDVNPHPNPGTSGVQWHDNKLGVTEVIITGYFTNKSATLGPQQLADWQDEDSINTALPAGRFGIRHDKFGNGVLNLNPTAAKGYILHDVIISSQQSPIGTLSFIAKFYRSRA